MGRAEHDLTLTALRGSAVASNVVAPTAATALPATHANPCPPPPPRPPGAPPALRHWPNVRQCTWTGRTACATPLRLCCAAQPVPRLPRRLRRPRRRLRRLLPRTPCGHRRPRCFPQRVLPHRRRRHRRRHRPTRRKHLQVSAVPKPTHQPVGSPCPLLFSVYTVHARSPGQLSFTPALRARQPHPRPAQQTPHGSPTSHNPVALHPVLPISPMHPPPKHAPPSPSY